MIETTAQRVFIFRMNPGADLLDDMARFLAEKNIRFGTASIIGALDKAILGAYSFEECVYKKYTYEREMEILHCTGNISMLDGAPFAHLHMVVSDIEGKAFGGHVFSGCKVKVAECIVTEFAGEPLIRQTDDTTGLKLWKIG